MLRRMEKRVAKLERHAAKLERENKALRAGQAELLEAMGQRVTCLALLPDGLRFVSGSRVVHPPRENERFGWTMGIARIAYHGLAPQ